jgi:hypothetical protein
MNRIYKSKSDYIPPDRKKWQTAHAFIFIGLILFCYVRFPYVVAAQTRKESCPEARLGLTAQFLGVIDPAESNSFSVRRVRIGVNGKILQGLHYKLSAEFSDSAVLLDAFAEFEILDPFSVRIGQFKIPFSMESYGSVAERDMINRSLIVNRLAPGRDIDAHGRDIGIAVVGKIKPLEYSFAVVNGAGINQADTDDIKDLAARLVLRPVAGIAIGGSLYHGRSPDGPVTIRDKSGVEIVANFGAYSLKGEYISTHSDQDCRGGWYLMGGLYLDRARALHITVRKEALDFNPVLNEYYRTWTLGINWSLAPKTKLQVNHESRHLNLERSAYSVFLVHFQVGF